MAIIFDFQTDFEVSNTKQFYVFSIIPLCILLRSTTYKKAVTQLTNFSLQLQWLFVFSTNNNTWINNIKFPFRYFVLQLPEQRIVREREIYIILN